MGMNGLRAAGGVAKKSAKKAAGGGFSGEWAWRQKAGYLYALGVVRCYMKTQGKKMPVTL